MRDSVYKGEVDIHYITLIPAKQSDTLIVAFPGRNSAFFNIEHVKWGYLNTIQTLGYNALFIRSGDDEGFSDHSRGTCHNRDFACEKAVVSLIEDIRIKTNSKEIVCCGTSMGGWTSMYYGLKYNWHILAGAPPYYFDRIDDITYTAGGASADDKEWANSLLPNVIKEAGNRKHNKYILLSWGTGEGNWRDQKIGPAICNDLDKSRIKYNLKLFDYTSHRSCLIYFQKLLKNYIKVALGSISEEESDSISLDIEYSKKDKILKTKSNIVELNLIDITNLNFDVRNIKTFGSEYTEDHKRLHYLIECACSGKIEKSIRLVTGGIFKRFKLLTANEYNIDADRILMFECSLAVFHGLQFFRNSDEFFKLTYKKQVERLSLITDYCFNKDGLCITGSSDEHLAISNLLNEILDFIIANEMPVLPLIKALKRKAKTISDVLHFLVTPDSYFMNIGQQDYVKTSITPAKDIKIFRESNFAVLSDENTYITICGGSYYHCNIKHSDVMAFTFRFCGRQLISEVGGGSFGLYEDFASSSMAHSSIICDDNNYVIPQTRDFTALSTSVVSDHYVFLRMMNYLYDGITLKRSIIWMKPNIIILCDECFSDTLHKYSQNFIIPKENENYVKITQFADKAELIKYVGQPQYKEGDLRGYTLSEMEILIPAINMEYSIKNTNATFITVIQGKSDTNNKELDVLDIKIGNDNIEVVLRNRDPINIQIPQEEGL